MKTLLAHPKNGKETEMTSFLLWCLAIRFTLGAIRNFARLAGELFQAGEGE